MKGFLKRLKNYFSRDKKQVYSLNIKEGEFKGYRLLANVMHFGAAGNYWLITVLDPSGRFVASFNNEVYWFARIDAECFIDNLIDSQDGKHKR